MKKVILILILSVTIIGTVLFAYLHSYSFNAITGNRCSDVYSIVVNGKELSKCKTEILMTKMNSNRYRRYFGDCGNTATLKYEFFDDCDNNLFDVIDIGNRNIIEVISNEEKCCYWVKERK